ncbi:sugar porter family MFS transporter [Flavivirga amylovorans]|uniref:Sugar porter family MFS transporter n=1 Tax=Flavivirga amylovorans TaxID=870486 RepID=A0ABT8WY60_9FLAO|nr:sugar porter family MFS transporter [Flavivirga amylovorans]MDO5986562.1 sugar porter family MFS transporter [Flavivirga amylovorans]
MENTKHFNFKYILSISMISALGGLLFGYDWVVIGGAKPFYERFFGISEIPHLQGWAMGSALIGCIVGAAIAGKVTERFGRKKPLGLAAFLFVVSAAGTGWFNDFNLFIVFRVLGGLGIGLASTISPMYIAEVSPSIYRGRLVSLNQLAIVIGILAAQFINFFIADVVPDNMTDLEIMNSWNGQTGWRWMFWAELVPAFLFFVLIFGIPESPRWLSKNKKMDLSKKVLLSIGGKDYAEDVQKEINETLQETASALSLKKLFKGKNRSLIIIGIILAFLQQWCGINVVFNYAEEVFASAGYGVSDALFNIILTGIVNLVFTLIAMQVIDRWGRKSLWLMGSLGLCTLYVFIGLFYFFELKGFALVVLIVAAIAVYALTLAPVFWVLASEIFPNKIRGAAMSITTTSLWLACFLLTYSFPILNKTMGTYGTFWVYAGICVLCFLFVKYKIPETKNKTLEEIEDLW